MNLINQSLSPLPDVLMRPRNDGSGRRHRIGQYPLDPDALQSFNDLLERFNLLEIPLERDQIASAGRELLDQACRSPASSPPCIRQRVRRGAAIDMMLADPDWETRDVATGLAMAIVDYLRGSHRLIPHAMPVVGRLDDALLIEKAWPTVAREVYDYADFCHVRRTEAWLRGLDDMHFGFRRDHWQAATQAEKAWQAHCQRVGHDSYLDGAPVMRFRVN